MKFLCLSLNWVLIVISVLSTIFVSYIFSNIRCLNEIYLKNIFRSMVIDALTIKVCKRSSPKTHRHRFWKPNSNKYIYVIRGVKITCKESGSMSHCVTSRLIQWFSTTSFATEFLKPFTPRVVPYSSERAAKCCRFQPVDVDRSASWAVLTLPWNYYKQIKTIILCF